MPVNKTSRGFEFYWEAEVTVSGIYGGEIESTVEICLSENDLLEMLEEIKDAKQKEE